MVEGNFEELRGYLEQLQEVMVQNGMPGSAAFEFALPDSFSEEGDGANGEEEDDGDDAEDSESEGALAAHACAHLKNGTALKSYRLSNRCLGFEINVLFCSFPVLQRTPSLGTNSTPL